MPYIFVPGDAKKNLSFVQKGISLTQFISFRTACFSPTVSKHINLLGRDWLDAVEVRGSTNTALASLSICFSTCGIQIQVLHLRLSSAEEVRN